MGYPYAKRLPKDAGDVSMQQYPPPFPALQTTAGNPVASSVISFNPGTTVIEVTAGNAELALKWGASSVIALAGTANYDHLIPINTTRKFVVPQSGMGISSVVGANALHGLYNSAALIVASSILSGLSEY